MNLNHTVKVVGSLILSAVMAGNMMPIYATETSSDDTNPTEKTETVYAVLNDDGSVSNTIVSSWLHDEDGISNIKETLNLKNVKNIKTSEEPSKSGNTYTWNASGNDVYYQGDATATLPVTLKIKYELDGKEVSSSNIEGKSGHLKMTLSFTNNQSETKTINGKNIVIHPSYLAGGIINMSTGNFTNVKCEQGKIVNDGSNEILAFASIPGLNETLESAGLSKVNDELGISDDVTVEADVEDFDLGSIMVGMTNEIDLDKELDSIADVSELTDGIDELVSADDQLIDGAKQLYDGTTTLKEEATPLTSASGQVRTLSSGAIQLNDGVKALQTGLTKYTAGVSLVDTGVSQLYAIPQGATDISSGMTTVKESGYSLVTASATLKGGLTQLSTTLAGTSASASYKNLMDNVTKAQTGIKQLQTVLSASTAEINNLKTTLDTASSSLSGLGTLISELKTIQTAIETDQTTVQEDNVKIETYNNTLNSVQSTKEALASAISSLKAARDAASQSGADVTDLNNKIDALEKQYSQIGDSTKLEQLTTLTEFNKALSDLSTISAQLSGTISSVQSTLNSLTGKDGSITKLNGYLSSASEGLTQMETLLKSSKDDTDAMQAMIPTLQKSVNGLLALSTAVDGGISTVNESLQTLADSSKSGIDQVKAGTSQLTENSSTLNSGAETLSEATGTLASQSDTFNEMADGLDTLGEAFTTLNDGAKQLYEGQQQFKDEGLSQLQEKVNLGVEELNTLQSVLDEIESMNKKYSSYSGAPEGATVTSRYVFRTKDSSED